MKKRTFSPAPIAAIRKQFDEGEWPIPNKQQTRFDPIKEKKP